MLFMRVRLLALGRRYMFTDGLAMCYNVLREDVYEMRTIMQISDIGELRVIIAEKIIRTRLKIDKMIEEMLRYWSSRNRLHEDEI